LRGWQIKKARKNPAVSQSEADIVKSEVGADRDAKRLFILEK